MCGCWMEKVQDRASSPTHHPEQPTDLRLTNDLGFNLTGFTDGDLQSFTANSITATLR